MTTCYKLRIGGTSDFVSKIDQDDPHCYPPGSIDTVSGWVHPEALQYDTREAAEVAARLAEQVEGCHVSVEEVKS